LTASVVLIGVIWPTLINLIVWGRWPAEAKGISLWRSPSSPKPTRPTPSFAAPRAADGDAPPSTAPAPAGSTAAAVRTLGGGPLVLAPTAAASHKEFGADPDDFYPTEQKARHQH
jgi:hypothetical protein